MVQKNFPKRYHTVQLSRQGDIKKNQRKFSDIHNQKELKGNEKIAGKTTRIACIKTDDESKTWGKEFIIRDNYKSMDDWGDMGYPRLFQRTDGKLMAMYYWASPEHPQHFIAASIWKP